MRLYDEANENLSWREILQQDEIWQAVENSMATGRQNGSLTSMLQDDQRQQKEVNIQHSHAIIRRKSRHIDHSTRPKTH
jgi:hypothetical protein